MGVHVRVDLIEGFDLQLFIKGILEYTSAKRFIVAREAPKNNPHVHVYLDTERTDTDVRNWVSRKFKLLKKDHKCVKKWGDTDADLRYYCKGDKTGVWKNVDILKTSFQYDEIVRFNKEFYEHAPREKNRGTVTQWLTEACRRKAIHDELGIIQEFIRLRKGKDGICPFKHGPMIRSVYLALNSESECMEIALKMREKIFGF